MNRVYQVRIRRYDPTTQKGPRYQSYTIEGEERKTLLEMLKEVYSKYDGEISFRWSCGMGKCGICAVQANGRRTLACQHVVEEREVTIEPVRDRPVIRDLTTALEQKPADPERGEKRGREEME